jgi:uncharacterized protein
MQTTSYPITNNVVSKLFKLSNLLPHHHACTESDLSELFDLSDLRPHPSRMYRVKFVKFVKFVKIVKFVKVGSKSRHDRLHLPRLCKSPALVKRYAAEVGTSWVESISTRSAANSIMIAQITPAEVVSGIMRRKREGYITPRTAHAIRLMVDRHVNRDYVVIGLSERIVQHAENLLEQYPLRAYDSVQLATALEANARLLSQGYPAIVFVSADSRLMMTASAEGLMTDDPHLHA